MLQDYVLPAVTGIMPPAALRTDLEALSGVGKPRIEANRCMFDHWKRCRQQIVREHPG